MKERELNNIPKAKYCYGNDFKGLTIKGNNINIKLIVEKLNVQMLLECLAANKIIELEEVEIKNEINISE